VTDLQVVKEPPQCETCRYLSNGFRCQRITTSMYARKVSDLTTGCEQWERDPSRKQKDAR